MRYVTLPGTNITTTALGFGTSSLMGKLSKKDSVRLLEVAYDNGIRHFDTAPLYGYGEAELVLGDFLRSREDVTIATKVGLTHGHVNAALLGRVKHLLRPLINRLPAARRKVMTVVKAGVQPTSNFSPAIVRESLDRSLRRLKRDRVDLYLLHECRIADIQAEALFAVLDRAHAEGKIRAFGLATDISTIIEAMLQGLHFGSVLQFANNLAERNLEKNPELRSHACIVHSPFGGVNKADASMTGNSLAYARQQNSEGIVLFSSQQQEHIGDNVRAFNQS